MKRIQIDGDHIAELVQKARKPHECKMCYEIINTRESYYQVIIGHGGVSSLKHPTRIHAGCLEQYRNIILQRNAQIERRLQDEYATITQ